jgi:lipoyl(octanoyl) transferase
MLGSNFADRRWRLVFTPPLDGVENMALDEALMARARRSGEGVVRVYSWSAPTLSLGRNQRAAGVYTAQRAAERGVAVVRRATGGRALLHHREITYSVTAPAPAHESLATSYRAINAVLLDALRTLGVAVMVAERGERLPATGELIVDGRKLVGSAQFREQEAMLQHGSILVDDDQAMVVELSAVPVGTTAAASTLRQALAHPPAPRDFADVLFAAVRKTWDASAGEMDRHEIDGEALQGARARYASDDWTWRR